MLNWLTETQDLYTRAGAADLQSKIHEGMLEKFSTPEAANDFITSGRNAWRKSAVVRSQLVMGHSFQGKVLEIGAGSGWCSSLLSNIDEVQHIYCLDYDPVSVELLMPLVQKSFGANPKKIERVLGSYNDMPLQDEIDLVISIGALHHAENLVACLSSCFSALKPGGWLFATEPAYYDSESNSDILKRYKTEDPNALKKYGKITKHEDNSDHYYRISEYIAAGYGAKFDVFPFVFDLDGHRHADDNTLRLRKTSSGFHTNVLYPYFAPNPSNPVFDRLFLMLQKPLNGGIELGHKTSLI
ncbi:MAG: class I SAM-dependent methyltransferase [Rhodospirillaceae bacterium]